MLDPTDVKHAAPGILGSFFAALWLRDTWPRRIAFVAAGAAASHYASPSFAKWLALDLPLAGFLVGLFGMAVVGKAFETIESVKPSKVVDTVLKKWGVR